MARFAVFDPDRRLHRHRLRRRRCAGPSPPAEGDGRMAGHGRRPRRLDHGGQSAVRPRSRAARRARIRRRREEPVRVLGGRGEPGASTSSNCGVFGERTDEIARAPRELRRGSGRRDRPGRDQRHRAGARRGPARLMSDAIAVAPRRTSTAMLGRGEELGLDVVRWPTSCRGTTATRRRRPDRASSTPRSRRSPSAADVPLIDFHDALEDPDAAGHDGAASTPTTATTRRSRATASWASSWPRSSPNCAQSFGLRSSAGTVPDPSSPPYIPGGHVPNQLSRAPSIVIVVPE